MYREQTPATSSSLNPPLPSHAPLPTQDRIDKIQYLLNKTLGPEHVASRPGGGGTKLSYLEGWRAINIANEVFGYNGWYTDIKYLEADFIDHNPETQRYCIGVTAIVRVRLQDGASHEDIGYGKLENTKSKADGLDKCKKEAVTDALKRALRHFGKLLGNCLYDKAYLEGLSKMKAPKPKFDFAGIYKPEVDNVPLSHPSAPWTAAPAAIESKPIPPHTAASPSASTSMPPPPPPKPATIAATGRPAPRQQAAHLNRSKTVPSSASTGTAAAKPQPPARPPAPPAPQRSTTVAASSAAPRVGQQTAKPNPLDRSGATTAAEFALDSEDESLLAGMDLDTAATAVGGDTSMSSEGDMNIVANGTGLVYFEGDSGFAEIEELASLKDESSRPSASSRPPAAPTGQPPQRPSPTDNKLAAQARLAEKHREAQARLAENQRRKEQQQQQQQHAQQAQQQPAPPTGATTSAAQLLRASTVGAPQTSNAALLPALGTARPPGLRPAQPPSRSTSLNSNNSSSTNPQHKVFLPGLTGAGHRSAGSHLVRTPSVGGGNGNIPAAGGAAGVSEMVSASPPKQGSVGNGEGFVSARGVKRGVGEGYDPTPPVPKGHSSHQQPRHLTTGSRHPLGELPVDGETGAVGKRMRS
ncbi:hypothetical protein JCM11641_006096 [Rhodosporidiobolus odoratus]